MFVRILFLILTFVGFFNQCYSQREPYSDLQNKYEFYRKENKLDSALFFLNKLGNEFYKKDRLKSADSCFQIALEILDTQKTNIKGLALICNNLGEINLKLENIKSAEIYLNRSLEMTKKYYGEYHQKVASVYNNLAILYDKSGDFSSSLTCFGQSIKIIIDEKDSVKLAALFHNIGIVYSRIGDYSKSEFYLYQALEIRKNLIGIESIQYARTLNSLGVLMHTKGDFKTAEYFIKSALENKKRISGITSIDVAESLNSLGCLYDDIANFIQAKSCFEKALEIRLSILGPEHSDYAESLNNLGKVYFELKDFQSTEFLLKKSIEVEEISLGKEQPNYAAYLKNLGVFYRETGNYTLSKVYLLEALNKEKKYFGEYHIKYASSLKNLALLSFKTGDDKSTYLYNIQALEIYKKQLGDRHTEYLNCLFNLGNLFCKLGDFQKTDSIYKIVFAGKIEELKLNFSWLSSNEKNSYWKKAIIVFNNIYDFSSKAENYNRPSIELSFNASLISKSLLQETSRDLYQEIAESSDQEMKAQFNEMKQLRRIYNKLQSEGLDKKEIMDRYKFQADSLDKILVNKLGEYAASKRKFEITWKDVQANLTSADAAIEFARYYDFNDSIYKYMALVVRPEYEYPKLVKLGSEVNIKNASSQKEFSELYNYVWRGVDSLLLGVKTVYYSPVGELNNISFSALISDIKTSNQIDTNQSNWSYLMDRYELHQLTTTRYLADETLKKNKPLPLSIKLVGGVNYSELPLVKDSISKEESKEDFAFQINLQNEMKVNGAERGGKINYLKGSEIEVNEVSQLLQDSGWSTTTLSGRNAGEYQFKEELNKTSPGILHVATHGFAFPEKEIKNEESFQMNEKSSYKVSDDPMVRCGLMFSGANISWSDDPQKMIQASGDDGILTAAEVSNMDLSNTKLVVLSACESGLGKIESSEGTFGLKRGFKLAGVEQLIVSLWSVPDKETMELMSLFYRDLSTTKNPVISFEKAQKQMRVLYPNDPEKWAGFVLVR